MTKRTPEELKKMRVANLAKARAAKNGKAAATHASPVGPALEAVRQMEKATPHEFAGITRTECCADCNADRCVISGKPVCAHPMKGGLQPIHMLDQDANERYNRVRKHLAHGEVERRQQ